MHEKQRYIFFTIYHEDEIDIYFKDEENHKEKEPGKETTLTKMHNLAPNLLLSPKAIPYRTQMTVLLPFVPL